LQTAQSSDGHFSAVLKLPDQLPWQKVVVRVATAEFDEAFAQGTLVLPVKKSCGRVTNSSLVAKPKQPEDNERAANHRQRRSALGPAHHELPRKAPDDHYNADHNVNDPSHGGIMPEETVSRKRFAHVSY
jgi:hypothetical protein